MSDKDARDTGLAGSMIGRRGSRAANLGAVDHRTEGRYRGLVDDAVLGARGCEKLVRVINISAQGAMITPAPALRIGEKVVLRLAGDLTVTGAVRWIRDGRMGINFATLLVIQT